MGNFNEKGCFGRNGKYGNESPAGPALVRLHASFPLGLLPSDPCARVMNGDLFLREPQPLQRWELPAVLLVTVLGGILRLWSIGDVPPGLWYDEAIIGLGVLKILREPGLPIFFMLQGHAEEPLFYYLNVPGVLIGGANGLSLRVTSAIIGTLTVPAVWWSARQFLDPKRALLAAIIFAGMRWHVHFSRLSFRTLLSPIACALITGFLARAVRSWRKSDLIAAGALTGLGLYTYLSMRLYVIIAALSLLTGWWIMRACPIRRLALWAAAAAMVFLPLGIDYIVHPEHFSARQGEVTENMSAGLVAKQVRDIALMPAFRGDHVGKHNVPGSPRFLQTYVLGSDVEDAHARWIDASRSREGAPDRHGTGLPVFDLLTGMVFYVGVVLVIAAAIRREWPAIHLLLWLTIGSLASVLSFGAPNMLRLLYLAPVAAMILACAAEWIARRTGMKPRVQLSLLVAFSVWFVAGESYRYFQLWPKHPAVWGEFNSAFAEAAQTLRTQSDAPSTIVVPEYILNAPTFEFESDVIRERLRGDASDEIPAEAWWLAPAPPWPGLKSLPQPAVPILELRDRNGETWARVFETKENGPE